MDFTNTDTFFAGNRFYIAMAAGSPTAGNCTTIADAIEAAWVANLAAQTHESWSLTEVDVLDITTLTGSSGQWTGDEAGTLGGTAVVSAAAVNVEFNIARRYRGGKPRIFWVPPSTSAQLDASHWDADTIAGFNTGTAAFFAAIAALDVGTVGALSHVNLSYYKGFTNIMNSSGRERAVPTYRDSALVDAISGYSTKGEIGSQRRRRVATTY